MEDIQKKRPIVSVICPFFNAESTLIRAINSVKSQTYANWELILVDDGSTDGGCDVVREQASEVEDGKIRLLTSNHSGPAKARNIGMDAACGEYISFIDADDMYKSDMLATMMSLATTNNADIVMCSFEKVRGVETFTVSHLLGYGALDEMDVKNRLLRLYFQRNKRGVASLCNKIFRRSFINDNKLRLNTNMRHAEDWHFILDCLMVSPMPVVAVTEDVLYDYIENMSSITHEINPMSYAQSFISTQRLMDVNSHFNLGEDNQVYSEVMLNCLTIIINFMRMDDQKISQRCIKEIEHNNQFRQSLQHAFSLELPLHYKVIACIWSIGGRNFSLMILRTMAWLKNVIRH